jgi:hypothetical protein
VSPSHSHRTISQPRSLTLTASSRPHLRRLKTSAVWTSTVSLPPRYHNLHRLITFAISQLPLSHDLRRLTTFTVSRLPRLTVSHSRYHSLTVSLPSRYFFCRGFVDFDLGICMIRVLWVAFCHNFFFFCCWFCYRDIISLGCGLWL